MGKKRERKYTWYVEPLDSDTNKALSRELSPENAMSIVDNQRMPHQVYLTDSSKLAIFENSKEQIGLRFKVYVREGNGVIRIYRFHRASRRRRNALGFPKPAQAASMK